jgi:hypothetical protein
MTLDPCIRQVAGGVVGVGVFVGVGVLDRVRGLQTQRPILHTAGVPPQNLLPLQVFPFTQIIPDVGVGMLVGVRVIVGSGHVTSPLGDILM